MLESDYLAMEHNVVGADLVSAHERADTSSAPTNEMTKSIIRKIIIPALEKEVNEGKNFEQLRQVYNSYILAAWYKKKIKESILSQVYVDRQKIQGVNIDDPKESAKIWGQYVEAFKKGVFNFIKEEQDAVTDEVVPRKYFSGGVVLNDGEMDIVDKGEELGASGMVAPKEALLIKMHLRPEPQGDMPAGHPIFYSRQDLLEKIVDAAPKLRNVFSKYGFGSGPEFITGLTSSFKRMQRWEVGNVDELENLLSEELSKERNILLGTPGYLERGLTRFLGAISLLYQGDPLSAYEQGPQRKIEMAQHMMKRWVGVELDPKTVFFDYKLDWRLSSDFRHRPFIRITTLPVQYGVSTSILIHESLHGASRGFDANWLNEAVTQRLSLEILNLEHAYISDSFRGGYKKEQDMLSILAKVVGGYAPIILAYFTGDAQPLFKALGPHAALVWRLFEALDDIHSSNFIKQKMLSAILRNLDSRAGLIRLGNIFRDEKEVFYENPSHILPFIAKDLERPLVLSSEVENIKKDFLYRDVSDNILLERTISAYVEGFEEEDLFLKGEDWAMSNVDASEIMLTEKVAMVDQDRQYVQATLPDLDLEQALIFPWKEGVRNFVQTINDTYDGDKKYDPDAARQNRLNYFENSKAVRGAGLILMADIKNGKVQTKEDFEQRLSQLNTLLLTGIDGKTFYVTPTMEEMGITIDNVLGPTVNQSSIEKILSMAGRYQPFKYSEPYKTFFNDFYERIKFFFLDDKKKMSSFEVVERIAFVYEAGLGYFVRGNNALFMNLANMMLRLYGLNGIPHAEIDLEVGNGQHGVAIAFTQAVLEQNKDLYREAPIDWEESMEALSSDDLRKMQQEASPQDETMSLSEMLHRLTTEERKGRIRSKHPNEIPGGMDAMNELKDAAKQPPLNAYQVTKFLKDEEGYAFEIVLDHPGGDRAILKIFLGEGPFEKREPQPFDAFIDQGVVWVNAGHPWLPSARHWKDRSGSSYAEHWSQSKWAKDDLHVLVQPLLEGRPNKTELDEFVAIIKESGYKPAFAWNLNNAPIRCGQDRKFYLMDPTAVKDAAGITGGIDLTPERMDLQTTGDGKDNAMEFKFDAAEIQRLEKVPGFVPVIMDIQPVNDFWGFLGLASSQFNRIE
jgi:hypothetical protein